LDDVINRVAMEDYMSEDEDEELEENEENER